MQLCIFIIDTTKATTRWKVTPQKSYYKHPATYLWGNTLFLLSITLFTLNNL
ncbi:MAG: hypothetical protein K0Q79_2396 [Flavipsychrobacter sp.]|jgi:hypothetical protein|nr:hypothetical protein [Flavipsychrobacter sp.]